MSRQESRNSSGNCQADYRQESSSSAGNCQADEPTGITQLRWQYILPKDKEIKELGLFREGISRCSAFLHPIPSKGTKGSATPSLPKLNPHKGSFQKLLRGLHMRSLNSGRWKWSCSVVSDSSRPHGLQPTRLLHPWDFPGKSAGVGSQCLLWPSVDMLWS